MLVGRPPFETSQLETTYTYKPKEEGPASLLTRY